MTDFGLAALLVGWVALAVTAWAIVLDYRWGHDCR